MHQIESGKRFGLVLAIVATVAAMVSFQVGAALAKDLFPAVGTLGAATLRLGLGAAMLMAIARPWRAWPSHRPLFPVLGLGIAVACTVVMFYLALDRLPLGIVISLQFLGPLAIAICGSRRTTDLTWAVLAAAGVWCVAVSPTGTMSIDSIGVLWALGAACGWAAYILCGRAAGISLGTSTAAVAASIAALLLLPLGAYQAGSSLISTSLMPIALLVALFSTAIPFSLELYAISRMPIRTFAVLMSLEPALGIISGFFILGETLTGSQIFGIGMVVSAAAGAALSSQDTERKA